MKNLQDIITESLQELYHFTNASNLMNIIKDDTWIASIDDTINGDELYISTTRSKYAGTGYPTQLIDNNNIIRIVFDGNKLNSKFKIKPIDKMKGKKLAMKSHWDKLRPGMWEQNKNYIMQQGNVEAEDRVYVKEKEIKNIHKYIKSIHIDLSNLDNKYLNPIKDYCELHNIELRKYGNTKKFNLGS